MEMHARTGKITPARMHLQEQCRVPGTILWQCNWNDCMHALEE